MIALHVPEPPARSLDPGDPPAIVSPGPRQASFGRIVVNVSPGTERIELFVNDELVRDRAVTASPVQLTVELPSADSELRVEAHGVSGPIGSDSVSRVFGLPRAGAPVPVKPRLEWLLQRRLRTLAGDFPGTTGFYVLNLRTGFGAGWNARARFPAASTVKLGIAVEVLRRLKTIPAESSTLGIWLRKMLVGSSNKTANELLEWLGGSTTAGAAHVTSTLRRVGLSNTYMYGGYILGTASNRPIPLNVVSQPSFTGKYTSAHDLARLHKHLHSATTGGGPLITRLNGFTRAEARHVMYHLVHSADRGKLDRFVADRADAIPHKAGWITTARHDAGIVYWQGGAFVAAVMTWNPNGVGPGADVLAGRMAQTALDRYEALARSARSGATERDTAA